MTLTVGDENTADMVHARLRDAILSGKYRPNQRLIEVDLANEIGVSRTPVREALLRLRHDGLVGQRKGWIVRDLDSREVLDYLEARAALEGVTAGLAAKRITREELDQLHALVHQMETSDLNQREYSALNSRFHALITSAGGNKVLSALARNTDINYWTFSTPIVFSAAEDHRVDRDHRELVAALEAGDAELAARLAREHVNATASILARALGLASH
ncbi:GntR family transcriptional regulator [Microbacterium sp.]|uniref:GntR family transcriptional regulator n=1 Tax=Microbacterium sp. TaxID=51671 RepID=UPI003C7113E5